MFSLHYKKAVWPQTETMTGWLLSLVQGEQASGPELKNEKEME